MMLRSDFFTPDYFENNYVRDQFMGKVYLTEKELATRWNLLPKTLRQWRWDKKGPKYSKIGGRISYRPEDVEKFEENNNEEEKSKDSKKTKKSN